MRLVARALQILSIDVVIGALICSIFISQVLAVDISITGIICLGLTVWIIYSIDHFMDSLKLKLGGMDRHKLYQRRPLAMKVAIAFAITINTVLVLFLPTSIIKFGIVLTSLVLIYFIFIKLGPKYSGFFKEFFVALIYSAGLFAPSVESITTLSLSVVLLYVTFFILAWLNLLLFSWFDSEYDKNVGFDSIVTFIGEKKTRLVIKVVLFVFLTTVLVLVLINSQILPLNALFMTLIMGSVLALLAFNPKPFKQGQIFRLLGDGIFLLPIIYLFL